MLSEILMFFTTALAGLYFWQQHTLNYWKRHNVKYVKPTPFLGNMKEMIKMKQCFGEQIWSLYKTPGMENEPVVGIYSLLRPALLIRDIELVKRVMIKNFNNFSNRVLNADPHHDPLGSNNLFFVRNPEWRELRVKLSPVFTSGKVKQMYPLMVEIGKELESKLASYPNNTIMEIKEICARFTVDLIGTTAFGIRANSLKNADSEFFIHSRAIFEITVKRAFDFFCTLVVPSLNSILRIKVFSESTSNFLRASIKHVMAERESTGIKRNDLIDVLVAMKKEALAQPEKPNPAKNFDFLVAQATVFQTAGYETSSSTMSFALYELALHQEVQDRLREEIRSSFNEVEGIVSYERIHEMPYLGQVLDETLRKYPIVSFLERECTPEAGSDGYSLKPFNDFVIPAGTAVYISPLGLHYDEKYWTEPYKFDPSRFAPENRHNINTNAYIPFGIGPHNCIGMRIGLLQSKLGLVHLLKNHRVSACDTTSKCIQFDPKTPLLANKDGIYLKLERIGY